MAPVLGLQDRAASTAQFQDLWRQGGIPVVVKGATEACSLSWDPAYFTKSWGDVQCLLFDCSQVDSTTRTSTNGIIEATVGHFFDGYENFTLDSDSRARPWKIKDWPPTAEMRETFPDIFQDFENIVPFPEHTTRKGPFNLCSFLPDKSIKPDLGPKMYLAYPTADFLDPNYKGPILGSTNLHLDITDAVNILMHVSANGPPNPKYKDLPEGTGAIWDIFPPSAADPIREYLHKARKEKTDDPIHRQMFYLTDNDIANLDPKDRPYRIYQKLGESVFIPAGCPHQVRNVRSCIKIAVDFFSAENTMVSSHLAMEARGLCGIDSILSGKPLIALASQTLKKEDVLGMYMSLYHAWKGLKAMQTGKWKERTEPEVADVSFNLETGSRKGNTKTTRIKLAPREGSEGKGRRTRSTLTTVQIKEDPNGEDFVPPQQSPARAATPLEPNNINNLVRRKGRKAAPDESFDCQTACRTKNISPTRKRDQAQFAVVKEPQEAYHSEGEESSCSSLSSAPDTEFSEELEDEQEDSDIEMESAAENPTANKTDTNTDADALDAAVAASAPIEAPPSVTPAEPVVEASAQVPQSATAATPTVGFSVQIPKSDRPTTTVAAAAPSTRNNSTVSLHQRHETIVIDDNPPSGSDYEEGHQTGMIPPFVHSCIIAERERANHHNHSSSYPTKKARATKENQGTSRRCSKAPKEHSRKRYNLPRLLSDLKY